MKSKSTSSLLLSTATLALASTITIHAADLTWNAAINSNWNTTDANWSGSTWNNATPDNAIFHSVGGTVTLDSGISAGSVSVGNTGSNFASLTLTGGSLNASTLTVQGAGGNSGAYGSNPTLSVNSSVSLTGDASVGRANLDITGGTFTANRIISASGSADWARLVISGGNVTATNGVDGSVNTGATFAIDLDGGTLNTPSIKVADREVGESNNAWLTFNGGTVKATASNSSFITTYGGGNNVYISNGGAIIDTNSHAITIGTALKNTAGHNGSLTKNGNGNLTLTQSNNYTGGTTVNNGMLVLAASAWTFDNVGGAGVTVASGATLRADNSVANQLNGLTLNGGTVDAVNSSGNGDWGNFFLTGNVSATGTSNLNGDIALRASNVDFNVASGGTLNVGGTMHNGAFFGIYNGVPATVSKSGSGTMAITGSQTYTGATTVSAGTLLVNGSLGNTAVIVNGGTIGGTGALAGSMTLSNGLFHVVDLSDALAVAGTISLYAGFGVDDLTGLDWGTVANGTYTLIDGALGSGVFDALANNSLATAYDIGSGRSAYYQQGSLQLVVIPESSSALLSGVGLLALLRRRRA
jgi:autotransporter-associated beta strand protein